MLHECYIRTALTVELFQAGSNPSRQLRRWVACMSAMPTTTQPDARGTRRLEGARTPTAWSSHTTATTRSRMERSAWPAMRGIRITNKEGNTIRYLPVKNNRGE